MSFDFSWTYCPPWVEGIFLKKKSKRPLKGTHVYVTQLKLIEFSIIMKGENEEDYLIGAQKTGRRPQIPSTEELCTPEATPF